MTTPEDEGKTEDIEEIGEEELEHAQGGAANNKSARKGRRAKSAEGFSSHQVMTVPYTHMAPHGIDCVHGGPGGETD